MSASAVQSIPSAFPSVRSVRTSSWKAEYEKTIWETDNDKLLPCIHATEAALFHRWQELSDDSMAQEERAAMNAAAADLLAIKLHKLGWPGLKP
jgi:predicted glycosyl hydrolase (DUF1957 family)